jgi:glutathionylspermidine synthase
MKWMLIERRPDVIYSGSAQTYLGENNAETPSSALAVTFATREAAEAHRRTLKHPYNWVAITAAD